jgi:geranylgeranyl pyrophosphate synthase
LGGGHLFNYKEKLREMLDFINNTLIELDLSNVHPILGDPTRYAMVSGGKRLRPIICMLCAEAAGGDYRETKEAFLALELIHNGTLVHDDIIDEDLFRRGNPSMHVKFGGKRAILAGDALLSLGLKYASRTGKLGIVDWLSGTALKMVQGVALQTFHRRKLISEEEYLTINYLKSGSLFEAAGALGGIIGSDNPEDLIRLAEFGRNFGNAYQIRDDVCGVYKEDDNEDLSRLDLLNGDSSLPFIYALESDSISEEDRKKILSPYLFKDNNIDLEEVQRIYRDTGALEKSIIKMKEFAQLGREKIVSFESTKAKEFLNYLIDQYYIKFHPKVKLELIT